LAAYTQSQSVEADLAEFIKESLEEFIESTALLLPENIRSICTGFVLDNGVIKLSGKSEISAQAEQFLQLCERHGYNPQALIHRLNLTYKLTQIDDQYKVPSTSLPVYLFAADAPAVGVDRKQQRDWEAVVNQQLKMIPVKGDHNSIMSNPAHVEQLAAVMTTALNLSESKALSPVETNSSDYSPLIMIQQGKQEVVPLYCIPGAGATVASFLSLTEALGEQQPIYGLQPRGLDGQCAPHMSVISAAASYVREIRKSGRTGPYQLLGHSFGGWKLIGLMEMRCGQSFDLTSEKLDGLTEIKQLEELLGRMKKNGLVSATCQMEDIRGMVKVFMANLNSDYRPSQVYKGRVVLISAKDCEKNKALSVVKMADQWKVYAPNLVSLEVPGNHMTMLEAPNAKHLTECVDSFLLPPLQQTMQG